MQWEYNAWAYNIKSTQPNPKISQKPKKNFKGPKPRSKNAWMHEKEGIKNTYQVIEAWSRPKKKWVEWFEWGREDLSERVYFLSREKLKSEVWITPVL